MKILFLISGDRVPSSRYRILPYVPLLREAGHRCLVLASFPQKYEFFGWLGFRPSQWLKRMVRRWHLMRARWARCDVIVLERELFDSPSADLERRFRQCAPAMILDIDDAVFLRYPEKMKEITALCHHVFAGNRLLAEAVGAWCSEFTIVPTAVNPSEYGHWPRPDNARPVIGWIGTSANVPYLEAVVEALQRLEQDTPFELRVISGDAADVSGLRQRLDCVRFRPWSADTAAREVSQFDIGIMPLPDDDWSRYKCGFKLLQYMAAALPVVASPVGVNVDLINVNENGFLAVTTEDWYESLRALLLDRELRDRMGARGRDLLTENYTVQSNMPRILAGLDRALASATAG